MQGRDAEAQTFFLTCFFLKGAARCPGQGWTSPASPAMLPSLVAAPVPLSLSAAWSKVNFNCPHPSDAHFNGLGRLPQDPAHEEGEMIFS